MSAAKRGLSGPNGRAAHRRPRSRCGLAVALCATALTHAAVGVSGAQAQERAEREYEVKAAFLYNFTKFVEWPDDSGTDRRICVLGADPFGSALEVLAGRVTRGKTVEILRLDSVGEAARCHVLFISSSVGHDLGTILDALSSDSILTVGETGRFAERGGMIALDTYKNRIRLRINLEATVRADLDLSSHLVRLAEILD